MRKNLIKARKEKQLTQREVAEMIGISLRTYQNIEQGSRLGKIPTWDKLEDFFNQNQRFLRINTP